MPEDLAQTTRLLPDLARSASSSRSRSRTRSTSCKHDDLRLATGCDLRLVPRARVADPKARSRRLYRPATSRRCSELLDDGRPRHRGQGDRAEDEIVDLADLGRRRRRGADRQARQHDHLPGDQGEGARTSTSSRSRSACVVRYRVDGDLRGGDAAAARSCRTRSLSRIKIMAGLDIAEKRKPAGRQVPGEGRTGARSTSASRSCPTVHGEKVVLRILDSSEPRADARHARASSRRRSRTSASAIDAPYGMILVTGPTGSGKSTTLYSRGQGDPQRRRRTSSRSRTRSSTSSRASTRCR